MTPSSAEAGSSPEGEKNQLMQEQDKLYYGFFPLQGESKGVFSKVTNILNITESAR
jgi:hypothetical protein